MGTFVHPVKNNMGSFVHPVKMRWDLLSTLSKIARELLSMGSFVLYSLISNCISGETEQTMTGSLCIDISSLLVNVFLNKTITGKEQSQDTIRICRMHLDHGC